MKVKNKDPAPIQITAEQIRREAREQQPSEIRRRYTISDIQELEDYRLSRRKEFENLIRRTGCKNSTVWTRYAKWEENQKDFNRARSVWERALSVHYRNPSVWLQYVEMDIANKMVNHARIVLERAITLLPRVDHLWYKYIHMEELLMNLGSAREIFERWMQWEPDHHGWKAYIDFELRYHEVERARAIYQRYVKCLPTAESWIQYAKFESKHRGISQARECYKCAMELLGNDIDIELLMSFAGFEELAGEYERARAIYMHALQFFPSHSEDIYKRLINVEKSHGNTTGIEDTVLSKRKLEYAEALKQSPRNYDMWLEYIRVEEKTSAERAREAYERAVANMPPTNEKRYWRRYMYLWINYALYEELDMGDIERTREVYKVCLSIIPHKKFTFAKIWLMAAKFEIRQKNLCEARKILGRAIGVAPKDKVFREYIRIELQLGNILRCRILYEKYLEWSPSSSNTWIDYGEFEECCGETERARAIYKAGIQQPVLDMPERLWKSYIEFEINQGENEHATELYQGLLRKTKSVNVWLSYARFEASTEKGIERARQVYERGLNYFRTYGSELKEERKMLLDAWEQMEERLGGDADSVKRQQPRTVKRRRPMTDGHGQEEYYDYIFPGKEDNTFKLLQAAREWKRLKSQ